MSTKKTVTSINSAQLDPEDSSMIRTFSKTLRHCASKSNAMKFPFLSKVKPGTTESDASEPATRGPTPDKNNRFPTRLVWFHLVWRCLNKRYKIRVF